MEIREEVDGITMTRWKPHWVVTALCTGVVLLAIIGGCIVLATLFVQ